MKVKVSGGKNFRGLVNYQNKPDAEFVSSSSGPNPESFLLACATLVRARPDVKKPVLHFSLSQPVGEPLSIEKWIEVANDFLRDMGMSDHEFFAVRHNDKAHDHIHIAVSKIHSTGAIWDESFSAVRAIKICENLEVKHGLTMTKTLAQFRDEEGKRRHNLKSTELQQIARTGNPGSTRKAAIQEKIRRQNELKKSNHGQAGSERDDRNGDIKTGQGLVERATPNLGKVQVDGSQNFETNKGDSDSKITTPSPEKIDHFQTNILNGDHQNDYPRPARPLSSNCMQKLSQRGLATGSRRPKPANILSPSSLIDRHADRVMHRQPRDQNPIGIGRILSFSTSKNEVIFTKNNRRLAKLAEDRNSIIVFEIDREAIDFAIGHAVKSGLVPLSIFGTPDFILAAEQRADVLGVEIKDRVSASSLPNQASCKNQALTTKTEGLKTMYTPSLDRLKIELEKVDAAIKNGNVKSAETEWRYPAKIREWIKSEQKLDKTRSETEFLLIAELDSRIGKKTVQNLREEDEKEWNENREAAAQSHNKMRM